MATIEHLPVAALKPWPRNARTHSRKQVKQLMESVRRFGFTQPILIDEDNRILAGHGRVSAAKQLGLAEVPCVRIAHLTLEEKRAYVLADNKLALNAGWNQKLLADELKDLVNAEVPLDIGLTGFSLAETTRLIAPEAGTRGARRAPPRGPAPQRAKPGDIFQLGPHWLICRAALDLATVARLLEEESPKLLITLPRDEAGPTEKAQAEMTESALMVANKAGANLFIAEATPQRCDEILRRWEAETGATAYWFYQGAAQAPARPEATP